MICNWPGCDRKAIRRGYCHRDSERMRRAGLLKPLPPKPAHRHTKRVLRSDEPVPDVEPTRTVSDQGYVLLRWLVGPREYVEEREHRIAAGRPPAHLEVHHLNGVRHDNRPENLQVLPARQHRQLHGGLGHLQAVAGRTGVSIPTSREYELVMEATRRSWSVIADAYVAGFTTVELADRFGVDESNISRGLRARGVAMRKGRLARIDRDLVLADLKAGVRADAIAEAHGVTSIVIHRIRRQHGIPAQPPGRPPADAPRPTVPA